MNILFINTFKGVGIYGVERWMLGLGRELVRRGHGVGLVGRPEGSLQRTAEEGGLTYVPLRIRSGLEFLAAWQLRRVLRARQVHAICGKIYKEVRVAALARMGLNIRLFQRRGAMGDVEDKLTDRLTLHFCVDRLIVPSRALKKDFARVPWLSGDRIAVLPHGVNLEDYRTVQPAVGLPSCSRRVAYVGRLIPVKGTDVLLRAWARVRERTTGARLLLVGACEEINYEKTAREMGLADTVDCVGFQEDVKPWIAASDALVLPSRQEGAGLVLPEAMALSKPVVASRVGGIPDYVCDGETGVLVDPGNPDVLADALVDLLADQARMRAMGRAGRARVESEFSLSAAADNFLELIEANG